MDDWTKAIVTFVGGFFTALVAKPLLEWMVRPRLRLSLNDSPDCLSFTPEGDFNKPSGHACYLRLRVRNWWGGVARNVQCFLVRIDLRLEGNRHFEQAPFFDTQELAWASRGPECWNPMHIPRGLTRYVDLLHSSTRHPVSFAPCIKYRPLREIVIGYPPGTWRFTVIAAGENVAPRRFTFDLEWRNSWNDFEVRAGRFRRVRISTRDHYARTPDAFKPSPDGGQPKI